jgi:hypothetical protein
MRLRYAPVLALVICGGISAAEAGWVIEEVTVATKPKGDAGPAEPATMRLSQGRVRMAQPATITVQDCVKGRFTIVVPDRNTYWTGTVDDYVAESMQPDPNTPGDPATADKAKKPAPNTPAKIDESKLPKIVVRKTEEKATIAGYEAVKYVIESNGKRFQEVWLTTAVKINDDLDPKRYLAFQSKMSGVMRGASADQFRALYRSPDYAALLASGLPLKTTTYHLAGSYTQEVRSVTRADVPDSDFAVPAGMEKAPLAQLFGPPAR